MKRILLATIAAAALSLPAMAQNNDQMQQPKQNEQIKQQQMQNDGQSGNPQETQGSQTQAPGANQQASERINPQDLSKDQVKQIQQALDQKGFSTKHVDGIWGPETASALRKFQEKNDIQAKGELNQQTFAQLGVNWSGQNQPQTTGSGQKSNEPMNNNENSTKMNKSGTSGSGSMNSNDTNAKPADQNSGSSTSGANGMGPNENGKAPSSSKDKSKY